MKTKSIIMGAIVVLVHLNNILAQSPVTIYTLKGTSLDEHTRSEYLSYQDKVNISADVQQTYPQATELNSPSATTTYNCHSYAWHISEGGSICTIAYYSGDTNESVYWTDGSYVETTESYASKISYTSDDHSAIQTSSQGIYISKWGNGPLMRHTRDYGPYDMSSRKYYKLNVQISGNTLSLCTNQERTFNSEVSIPGSTYSWSKTDALLDYVSGAGTTSYTVKGRSGSGAATVNLQMTTPSGEVASPNVPKYLWIGPPIVSYISGPYGSNPLSYYSMPTPDYGAGISYTWSLSPSGSLYYWMDHADVTLSNPGYYVLGAQASNSCGTTGWAYTYINYGGFLLSPNPASDEVTVSVNSNKSSEPDNSAISSSNYTISILNSSGVLCGQYQRSGSSFTLPISGLRDGQYYIKINNGKVESVKQLIVKH
jgi:hypothetical protein